MDKNINEVRKDLIEWTLWSHYDKEEMSEDEFRVLIDDLGSNESLAKDIKTLIITYSKIKTGYYERMMNDGNSN